MLPHLAEHCPDSSSSGATATAKYWSPGLDLGRNSLVENVAAITIDTSRLPKKKRIFGFGGRKFGTPKPGSPEEFPVYSKFDTTYNENLPVTEKVPLLKQAFSYLLEKQSLSPEELKKWLLRLEGITKSGKYNIEEGVEIAYGVSSLMLRHYQNSNPRHPKLLLSRLWDQINANMRASAKHSQADEWAKGMFLPNGKLSPKMSNWCDFNNLIEKEPTLNALRVGYRDNNIQAISENMSVIKSIFSQTTDFSAHTRIAAIVFMYHFMRRSQLTYQAVALNRSMLEGQYHFLTYERALLDRIMGR